MFNSKNEIPGSVTNVKFCILVYCFLISYFGCPKSNFGQLTRNTAQKMKFSIKDFFSILWPSPQLSANLVKFTEEIPNGKLHFLWSGGSLTHPMLITYLISTEGHREPWAPKSSREHQWDSSWKPSIRSWLSIPQCYSLQWLYTCFTSKVSPFILPRHLLFLNLFYRHTKNKNVFRSHFFSHFHVCTIQCSNGQTTIQLSITFICKKVPIYRLYNTNFCFRSLFEFVTEY